METLSIIGCGAVGRTLGRLWSRSNLVRIDCVHNRSLASAKQAVEFMGQGRPVERLSEAPPADLVMISTSDDAIEGCAARLAGERVARPGSLVFHCSGSLGSGVLRPLKDRGALVASLHPWKNFARPETAVDTFAGTPCGIEGDEPARQRLAQLVESSGGRPFEIKPGSKLLYHAGAVMISNYLIALLETGFRCFEAAGIPRGQAAGLARPLIEESVRNALDLGAEAALTGPIARGDHELVRRQLEALAQWDVLAARIYKSMGLASVELSRAKGRASAEALSRIIARLEAD